MKMFSNILFGLVILASNVFAWESEQLEVFDVVDEVGVNFYEMLNVTNDANATTIRSAFRRFSVLLHPDKNPNEDTSEKFRNLVSVYEVLKDVKKRAYYDDVLVNGLPNWKSAMYYYRRVRKMGILEGFIIVFFITTIGQYLVSWAAYFEHKFNQSSILEQSTKTRKQKKNQASIIFEEVPKPSVFNTLPFQIPYLFYYIIISIPSMVMCLKEIVAEKVEDAMTKEPESESEEEKVIEPKVRRRKPAFAIPEGPTFEVKETNHSRSEEEIIAPPVSGGLWTDDDLEELVQLVKKYPGGTPKRWNVIAEFIGRSVPEVTYMANRMKTNGYRMVAQEEEVVEEKVKLKTKGGKLGLDESISNWSQPQQRTLEDALAKYPKGILERWERIAECVPEKTKEECMLRYKHLVEVIKKQKDQ